MGKVSAVFVPLTFVAVLCSFASPAGADTIRVTSGVVDTAFGPPREPLDGEDLDLRAAGFEISSALEDEHAFVRLANPPTVAPGALVDFSGTLRVEDSIGAQLNNSFGLVAVPFEMSFHASPARLRCSSGGSVTQCTGIAPFTFDAKLTFTPFDGVPGMHHLIGRGTVEGDVSRFGSFDSIGVRYAFAASPTPEPATWSLAAIGAIAIGASVWRRRRAGYRDFTP